MCLVCEVTKKNKEEVTTAPREGAYVHGLYMEVLLTVITIDKGRAIKRFGCLL